jgi:hypothetical protein
MQSLYFPFHKNHDQTIPPHIGPRSDSESLDKSQLGGSDVESIEIGGKASIGLLGSIGAKRGCQSKGLV